MYLGYFPLDWSHYDLRFATTAEVIDTADDTVVSKARCAIRQDHSATLVGRQECLTQHAEKLKLVVMAKTAACLAELQRGLNLPVREGGLSGTPALAAYATGRSGDAPEASGVLFVSEASSACDEDKLRYAQKIGVPCSAFGGKVEFTQTAIATVR